MADGLNNNTNRIPKVQKTAHRRVTHRRISQQSAAHRRRSSQYNSGSMRYTQRLSQSSSAAHTDMSTPSPSYAYSLKRWQKLSVSAFSYILIAGFLIGCLFFVRPSASALENRKLTAFPAFSPEDFMSGTYTSKLALWYADTYPLREMFVAANQWLQRHYGISTKSKMIGGNIVADELPPKGKTIKEKFTKKDAPHKNEESKEPVEIPTEEAMAADIQNQIMNGLYVSNGAAYSIYYFVQEAVQKYTNAINTCSQALEGQAKVYSVLVPNNSAILDDATLQKLGGTNQQKAIRYFNSLYNPEVGTVDSWSAIREHKDEYIYFRTDHHWTQLGAYYVYRELCKSMEIKPVPIKNKKTLRFDGFLGTFYSQLHDPEMAANPDYVLAHIPNGTNDMTYIDHDGNKVKGKVVTDVSTWAKSSLYSTFIAGDEPLEHIHNPELNDSSSCLVIKDSYGCAFAPLLVDNFEDLYIIDFRYYNGKITDYVRENNIQNVVFINNISLAGANSVAEKLASMM